MSWISSKSAPAKSVPVDARPQLVDMMERPDDSRLKGSLELSEEVLVIKKDSREEGSKFSLARCILLVGGRGSGPSTALRLPRALAEGLVLL